MTDSVEMEKFETLGNKFQCPICQECMCVPQSLQKCKHTYCYECLKKWFMKSIRINTLRCPMCRLVVEDEPFNNKILQSVIIAYNEIITNKAYFERLRKEKLDYELDLKNNTLFEKTFKDTGMGVVDMDDGGVIRCSSCHWEIEPGEEDQNECPHCGVVFRSIGARVSDDGESIDTEGEQSDAHNDSGSDLTGFIISELSEDEVNNSESSMNSDYYEYNEDEVDESLDDRRKRKREEVVDLSNDDVVVKSRGSRNKRVVVLDDDE